MTKHVYVLLMFVFCASCKEQNKNNLPKDDFKSENKDLVPSYGPSSITRNVMEDRKGNIWIASWEGVFLYDGKSFTNVTSTVSSARFFSLLEDRRGNFWFASIGSGVYYYDGKSFLNFTIEHGLLNNDVGSIYEDKKGNIWFGGFGGASRYNGNSFRNYIIDGNTMKEDRTGKTFRERPPYEVNAIIEDKTGMLWFATRGNTFVYDGKKFTAFTNNGKPFTNVRTIIEDRKGNIWLGGNDGLWRYDGSTFTNFTQDFGGFIYEDRSGNIWTSTETSNGWALSRYDEKSLSDKKPIVTQIASKQMIFGIEEARDGSIWFGAVDGVYRYDGNTVIDFKPKEVSK